MFKIRINKSTSCIFIFFKNNFYKIPYSIHSIKSIRKEISNYKIVKSSDVFLRYLPRIQNYGFFFSLEIKKKVSIYEANNFFKSYLNQINDFKYKKKIALINLSHFQVVKNFTDKYLNHKLNILEKYLENNRLEICECHGDFYYKNILRKNKQYYFIDWPLYSKEGNIIFDLINFKIFSSRYYKNNWYEFLKKNKKHFCKFINEKYLDMFVLWKISNELKYIKLDNFKIKKYILILDDFLNDLKKINYENRF